MPILLMQDGADSAEGIPGPVDYQRATLDTVDIEEGLSPES